MKITSQTNLTGIIGYPLGKTLSPVMQNAAFNALEFNWAYVPMPVKPENLEVALKGLQSLGFKGLNVTMPHKEKVLVHLDEISSFAKMAEAVNTIHFEDSKIIGYNTDGRGFLHALENDGHFKPEGKKAVIFGAGGAARSIALILALNETASITIVNRTLGKAESLVASIKDRFTNTRFEALSFGDDLPKIIDSTDLIVNSTPVGWEGDLVIDPDWLHSGHLVVDLVYIPQETRLLEEAKNRGANILPGKLMLLYQGAASFEIWTKTVAPLEDMRKALDEELSKHSRR